MKDSTNIELVEDITSKGSVGNSLETFILGKMTFFQRELTLLEIRLMKYFKITELTKSATAQRLGIDNSPTPEVKRSLEALVDSILDPLREEYGRPIIVTSGYRCPRLNKAVGGAASSQHVRGEAADIRSLEDTPEENKKLYDLIIALGLPFDQLINEYNWDWIHVSFGARHRRQKLKAEKKGGKTVYTVLK